MKKIIYLLVAMAMISLTSCFGNAGNQEPTENEAVEEVIEEVENDTTACDTTAVWFEELITPENDTNL